MGIASLWKLLTEEGVVRKLSGSDPSQHHTLLSELDGTAIAVDLSAWIMQADQQLALLPHFGRTERCMKVALERSIQWLRHGCLPVIVVEGRAPAEKLAAVQARYAARNGVDGGGRGSSSFIALGKSVGVMLQQLGLPVFYSPGEAEATCAALVRAGRVDAAASFDSDTMVHGAERVYHTLKLSTLKPGECELVSCDLGDIRKALGIQRGGQVALSVIAMLAGSDYDLVGTSGVGSDDSGVLEALEALVARPPDAELAALTKCTGCKRCGHEGGRKGAGCRARAFARCDCAFHRREAERGVEAIARRIRADAAPLAAARAAAAVFQREAGAADAYVAARAAELGGAPGARLHWLHRPRTLAVWAELERRRVKLTWDLPMLRGKLLPLLLDWDLAHSGEENGAGEGGRAKRGPSSGRASTAEARSVRISAVRQHAAQLEQRHLSGYGLLARLLVQQRARALLGPKPSAGPAVARGPDSAVLAAARGSSGAGTQRSPAKSADIRRYVEQGSPGRLGATACEGGELDLTTPEGCCRSPAIDLTQT
ncbi:Flap endonuclease GEN-like protein 1 [Auxenochlorella protothecoides]|uniref:Flap endonuclease GEN-like protein 1 n=1 Tax=Auxenochlorella protothecoides TaxID=3075 RepID=A0A087SKH7_AUXPR|nr:Flap endonuclease GEN-like protein 1 [Auxenochlorella protothecoides]KFM26231.1 Flap endonuclease GEN-like protein 1 [Auxenochlorella protothecoides]